MLSFVFRTFPAKPDPAPPDVSILVIRMLSIDGRKLAAQIRTELKADISTLTPKPGLAIVLVGDDPASQTYVRLKERAAREIGMNFTRCDFPAEITETEVLARINQLNQDPNIHGIIVQLPLPKPLDPDRVINAIAPEKDADGFMKTSLERFRTDPAALPPVLCEGIWRLIASTGQTYPNAKAVVLANSATFGEPMALLLTRNGLDVQVAYPPFHKHQELTKNADVIVIAIGQPGFLKAQNVKPNCTIIDVGFNHVGNKTVGDVDAQSLQDTPGWLTPVPGGVGPMTVAALLKRTLELYTRYANQ